MGNQVGKLHTKFQLDSLIIERSDCRYTLVLLHICVGKPPSLHEFKKLREDLKNIFFLAFTETRPLGNVKKLLVKFHRGSPIRKFSKIGRTIIWKKNQCNP